MYRVTKQFARGLETTIDKFSNQGTAEAFIQGKLVEDARMKVETVYRIYDDIDEIIGEYTAANMKNIPISNSSSSVSASQSSQGKTISFNPTPFNLKPTPGGFPHSWVKDLEENKN